MKSIFLTVFVYLPAATFWLVAIAVTAAVLNDRAKKYYMEGGK